MGALLSKFPPELALLANLPVNKIYYKTCDTAAFDKGDLLYLRDEEEKKRFKEEELRDSERMQFLRMQASTTAGLSQDLPPSVPARAPDKAVPRCAY